MAKRKDTCIGQRCPFWRRYQDTCPNFVKGDWKTVEGHEYETKDCAPKRSMILCQQIYDHMLDVRRDYGHVREANRKVLENMQLMMNPIITIEPNNIELLEEPDGKDSTE